LAFLKRIKIDNKPNKMEKSGLVSIIMATYNREHLILETLESIQDQIYQNWECLIIDDGGNDSTGEVISHLLQQDKRFQYLQRPLKHKKGLPGCRNYGLEMAKGNYVIFFDDDDIVHPQNLQTCIKLIKNENYSFCRYDKMPFSGQWKSKWVIQKNNFHVQKVTIKNLEEIIIGKLAFASCCVLWEKKCFENIWFNEELQYAEEWECYSRILSLGISGASINKILYYNRKHPKSNTGEFRNNDPVRRASKVKAVILVIEHLYKKYLLSPSLIKYFIRTGFFLKEKSIIDKVLMRSNAGILKKWKYNLGFLFYPVLRPAFKIKGKMKNLGKSK
jgi:glycosyltransferase involved in cell wall biosynthesis